MYKNVANYGLLFYPNEYLHHRGQTLFLNTCVTLLRENVMLYLLWQDLSDTVYKIMSYCLQDSHSTGVPCWAGLQYRAAVIGRYACRSTWLVCHGQ